MSIMVTGGAGFIGSNFILEWIENFEELIINIDKLTYAGNLQNLNNLQTCKNHIFIKGDIADNKLISSLLYKYKPRSIINFAADTHVDRAIHNPSPFIHNNIVGTFELLETTKNYWNGLNKVEKNLFRFLHVSTDEVFGSLNNQDLPFEENHPYQPNSPYSASKAASNHLVRAYHQTYGLPVLTTNCSNNYGPYHFPEKLIPLIICNALRNKILPIYGDGQQVRDWLYVKDHCCALQRILAAGKIGETYNIGGWNEKTNLEVVETICLILDKLKPKKNSTPYKSQIIFVKDRLGHDRRYAINANKIKQHLDWSPKETFETGLHKTVQWYLDNQNWVNNIINNDNYQWVEEQYIS